jgi:hypothetical protein
MWTAWYVSTQNKEIVIVYFWGVTLHDPWSILDLHFKAPHPQIVLWMHSLLRISFSNDFMLVSLNFLALLSDRELKKSPVAALEGHHLLERCTHHVYGCQCILYSGNPSYTSSVLPTNEMWESLQVYHPMSTVTACMIWVLLCLKSVVPWILLFFLYILEQVGYISAVPAVHWSHIRIQNFIFIYVAFFNITYMFRLYTKVWSKIPTSELLMQVYFTNSLRFRHLYFQTILMIHTLNSNNFLCEWLT